MSGFDLINDKDYFAKMHRFEQQIEKQGQSGYVESFDGCRLFYEYLTAAEHKSAIVIVHGFTEFSKKYHEMMYYFFTAGFDVFIFDQRGHGYSSREVDDLHLSHVEKFEHYALDLDVFMRKVVIPAVGDKKINIFSHSMGGAVAAYYLAGENNVDKAVFSSPMICPCTHGVPRRILMKIVKHQAKTDGWKAKFKYAPEFNPHADFRLSADTNYQRFRANLDARIADEHYQNSSATNGWLYNSLLVFDWLIIKKNAAKIGTKSLIISAGQDTVVRINPQKQLAKMVKESAHLIIPQAKHSIFTGDVKTRHEFYGAIFDFLS